MAGLIHPQDVTILFQDGVGAHGATPQQALARFDLIRARHPKTEMIAEAFRPNPTPGGACFIPATAAEYQAQLQAYAHLDPVHVFDGPNYLDAALIQRIGGVEPALPPTALNARVNTGATRGWTGNAPAPRRWRWRNTASRSWTAWARKCCAAMRCPAVRPTASTPSTIAWPISVSRPPTWRGA